MKTDFGRCPTCGIPLKRDRDKYCSRECFVLGKHIGVMPEEEKEVRPRARSLAELEPQYAK